MSQFVRTYGKTKVALYFEFCNQIKTEKNEEKSLFNYRFFFMFTTGMYLGYLTSPLSSILCSFISALSCHNT